MTTDVRSRKLSEIEFKTNVRLHQDLPKTTLFGMKTTVYTYNDVVSAVVLWWIIVV